jgi:hypothetical protein
MHIYSHVMTKTEDLQLCVKQQDEATIERKFQDGRLYAINLMNSSKTSPNLNNN